MKMKKWLITSATIGTIAAPVAAVVSCTSSKGTITYEKSLGEAYGNTEWVFKITFDKQALALKLRKYKGDQNKAIQALIAEMKISLSTRLPDSVTKGEFKDTGPYIKNDGYTISFYYPVKSILKSKLKSNADLKSSFKKFITDSVKKDGKKAFIYNSADFEKYVTSTIISLVTEKSKDTKNPGSSFLAKYFVVFSNSDHVLTNGDYVQFDFTGYLKDDLTKYKDMDGKMDIPDFASNYSKKKAKDLVKNDAIASHLFKYETKAKWDAAVDATYTDEELTKLVNSQPYLTSYHATAFSDKFYVSVKDKNTLRSQVEDYVNKHKNKYDKEGLTGISEEVLKELPKETQKKIKEYAEDKKKHQDKFWKYFDVTLDRLKNEVNKLIEKLKNVKEMGELINKYDFLTYDETITSANPASPPPNVHDLNMLKDLVKDDKAAAKLKHYKSKKYWDDTVGALKSLAQAQELLAKEPSLKLPKDESFTSIYYYIPISKDDKDALLKLIKDDKEAKEHNFESKKKYDDTIDSMTVIGQIWTLEDRNGIKPKEIKSLKDFSYEDIKLNERDIEEFKKILPSSTLTTDSKISDLLTLEKTNKDKFKKEYSSEQSVRLLDDTDKQKAKDLAKDDEAVKKIKGFESKIKSDFDEAIDTIKTVDDLRVFLLAHELKQWDTYHSEVAKNPIKWTNSMKKEFENFIQKEMSENDKGEKSKLLKEYITDKFKTLISYFDEIKKFVSYDQYTEFFNENIKVIKLNENDRKHAKELIKDDEAATKKLNSIKTKEKWDEKIDEVKTLKDLKDLLKAEHKAGTDELKLNSYTSKEYISSNDVVKKPEDKDKPERIAPSGIDLSTKAASSEISKAVKKLNMKDGEERIIDLADLDPHKTILGYFFWSKMKGDENLYQDLMSKGDYDKIAYLQIKKVGDKYQYKLIRKLKAFKNGAAKNNIFKMGNNTFIKGFDTMMEGMKKDEKRSILPTFGDYYGSEDLAGKQVIFDITVHHIAYLKDLDKTDFIKEVVKKNDGIKNGLKDYGLDKINDMASFKDALSKQNRDQTKTSWYTEWLEEDAKELEFEFPRAVTYNIASNLFNQILRRYPSYMWQTIYKQRQSLIDKLMSTTYVHGKKTNGQALATAGKIEAARRYGLALGLKKTDKKDIQTVFKDYMKKEIPFKIVNKDE